MHLFIDSESSRDWSFCSNIFVILLSNFCNSVFWRTSFRVHTPLADESAIAYDVLTQVSAEAEIY